MGWLRGLARPAALAGMVVAGLCTGYLASRLVASEPPPTYCTYSYDGLTNAEVADLKAIGVSVQPGQTGDGAYYVCVTCPTGSTTTTSCQAPPHSVYVAVGDQTPTFSSGTCGACESPDE